MARRSSDAGPHRRRDAADVVAARPGAGRAPLADRVEWATWSILSTAGRIDEAGLLRPHLPALPRARRAGRGAGARLPGRLRGAGRARAAARPATSWPRGPRSTPASSRTLVDYGHRLGLRAWVAAPRARPDVRGRDAAGAPARRRAPRLPAAGDPRAGRGAGRASTRCGTVRGRLAFLFEVEWTAMIGEAVLAAAARSRSASSRRGSWSSRPSARSCCG